MLIEIHAPIFHKLGQLQKHSSWKFVRIMALRILHDAIVRDGKVFDLILYFCKWKNFGLGFYRIPLENRRSLWHVFSERDIIVVVKIDVRELNLIEVISKDRLREGLVNVENRNSWWNKWCHPQTLMFMRKEQVLWLEEISLPLSDGCGCFRSFLFIWVFLTHLLMSILFHFLDLK